MTNEWTREVLVICTDRGQHRPVKLRTVEFTPERARLARAVDPARADGGERVEYVKGRGGVLTGSVEFSCSHCPRNPQVDLDQLFRAAWEIQKAGGDRLDVSLIPS